jgi:hypothetical protein
MLWRIKVEFEIREFRKFRFELVMNLMVWQATIQAASTPRRGSNFRPASRPAW